MLPSRYSRLDSVQKSRALKEPVSEFRLSSLESRPPLFSFPFFPPPSRPTRRLLDPLQPSEPPTSTRAPSHTPQLLPPPLRSSPSLGNLNGRHYRLRTRLPRQYDTREISVPTEPCPTPRRRLGSPPRCAGAKHDGVSAPEVARSVGAERDGAVLEGGGAHRRKVSFQASFPRYLLDERN